MLRERLAARATPACSSTSSGTSRFRRPTSSACCRPWRTRACCAGMLGNDLLEFHTDRYAHELPRLRRRVRARRARCAASSARVRVGEREIHVGVVPDQHRRRALRVARAHARGARRAPPSCARSYAADGCALGVCVDRVDYTKGIPERLRALDQLWDRGARAARNASPSSSSRRRRAASSRSYKTLEDEVVRRRRRDQRAVRRRRLDADRAHQRERRRRAGSRASTARATCASSRRCRTG